MISGADPCFFRSSIGAFFGSAALSLVLLAAHVPDHAYAGPLQEGDAPKGSARPVARPFAASQAISPIRERFAAEAMRRTGREIISHRKILQIRKRPPSSELPNPSSFSTCIEFIMQLTSRFPETRHFRGPNAYAEINPAATDRLPDGAWHPCRPGGIERPSPGDIFVLQFEEDVYSRSDPARLKYGKGWFSHIGVHMASDGPGSSTAGEIWISVDGGTTSARQVERTFFPDNCSLKQSDTISRTLAGWIDIETFAAKGEGL